MTTTQQTTQKKHKPLKGVVVSTSMTDVVVVEVSQYKKHPKYNKYITIRKKYKVRDAGNTKQVGDKVEIEPTRPVSKGTHFKLVA